MRVGILPCEETHSVMILKLTISLKVLSCLGREEKSSVSVDQEGHWVQHLGGGDHSLYRCWTHLWPSLLRAVFLYFPPVYQMSASGCEMQWVLCTLYWTHAGELGWEEAQPMPNVLRAEERLRSTLPLENLQGWSHLQALSFLNGSWSWDIGTSVLVLGRLNKEKHK